MTIGELPRKKRTMSTVAPAASAAPAMTPHRRLREKDGADCPPEDEHADFAASFALDLDVFYGLGTRAPQHVHHPEE
jgi:hypothetical protein